jgi:hypothetical protein
VSVGVSEEDAEEEPTAVLIHPHPHEHPHDVHFHYCPPFVVVAAPLLEIAVVSFPAVPPSLYLAGSLLMSSVQQVTLDLLHLLATVVFMNCKEVV